MVLTRARWYFVNQTVDLLANCVGFKGAQWMQNHRKIGVKRVEIRGGGVVVFVGTPGIITVVRGRRTARRGALSSRSTTAPRLLSGSAVNIISGGPNTQSHW